MKRGSWIYRLDKDGFEKYPQNHVRCPVCETEFLTRNPKKYFCSDRCKRRSWNDARTCYICRFTGQGVYRKYMKELHLCAICYGSMKTYGDGTESISRDVFVCIVSALISQMKSRSSWDPKEVSEIEGTLRQSVEDYIKNTGVLRRRLKSVLKMYRMGKLPKKM